MVALHPVIADRARQVIAVLSRRATVRGVYVFGSQVSGTAHEWSDIDVAAFVDGVETWTLEGRVQAIVEVQREAGDDLDVHLFPGTFVDAAPRGSFAEFVLQEGVAVESQVTDPSANRHRLDNGGSN